MTAATYPQVVRDWWLPAGWEAREDLAVLGEDPPLFADPWGVLVGPGGPVGVAEHVAPVPGGRAGRRAPTLLVERRGLLLADDVARRLLADPAPIRPGRLRQHEVIAGPHGPVTLVRSRVWRPDGPAVQVVAVLVPPGSRDAVVLTLTWDDEDGLEALDALARATLEGLRLRLDPGPEHGVATVPVSAPGESRAGRRRLGLPHTWTGARRGGAVGSLAAGLTRAAHALLGTSFLRPALTAWGLLALFVLAVSLLAPTPVGGPLADAVVVVACLVPLLLAWRSWTLLHGLVTDPVDWTPRVPAATIRATGLWYYIASAAVLAVVLFGSFITPGWVRQTGFLALWAAAHLLLVVLEHARALTPRLRRRRHARSQSR